MLQVFRRFEIQEDPADHHRRGRRAEFPSLGCPFAQTQPAERTLIAPRIRYRMLRKCAQMLLANWTAIQYPLYRLRQSPPRTPKAWRYESNRSRLGFRR